MQCRGPSIFSIFIAWKGFRNAIIVIEKFVMKFVFYFLQNVFVFFFHNAIIIIIRLVLALWKFLLSQNENFQLLLMSYFMEMVICGLLMLILKIRR